MLSERPAAFALATASSSCCLLTVTPVQVHPVLCRAQAVMSQTLFASCGTPLCRIMCFSASRRGAHPANGSAASRSALTSR